jgi:hypothetical protein
MDRGPAEWPTSLTKMPLAIGRLLKHWPGGLADLPRWWRSVRLRLQIQ